MRAVLSLAACALAGCNLVLGLDPPSGGDGGGGLIDGAMIDGDATDGRPPDGVDGRPPTDGRPGTTDAITAGDLHTCARRGAEVWCWGFAESGRLGYGNQANVGDNEDPAVAGPVPIGAGIPIEVVAGGAHTCALLAGGAVRCWGMGGGGRLGYGNVTAIGDDELPQNAGDVPVGAPATALVAGAEHTCAVTSGMRARCWGRGASGRLGYGNQLNVGDAMVPSSAGDVPGLGNVIAIAAGAVHTCAVVDTGEVQCWGLGDKGRLGYGNLNTIGDDEEPTGMVDVGGLARAIVAGDAHTCVIRSDDTVVCWGNGADGRLGYANQHDLGDNESPGSVGEVFVGGPVEAIAAGTAHTCALLEDRTVRCWGRNGRGQLGTGNTDPIGDNERPASVLPVVLGGPVRAITAGGDHTCALLESGDLRCWGQGAVGQLGYGATVDVLSPLADGPVVF